MRPYATARCRAARPSTPGSAAAARPRSVLDELGPEPAARLCERDGPTEFDLAAHLRGPAARRHGRRAILVARPSAIVDRAMERARRGLPRLVDRVRNGPPSVPSRCRGCGRCSTSSSTWCTTRTCGRANGLAPRTDRRRPQDAGVGHRPLAPRCSASSRCAGSTCGRVARLRRPGGDGRAVRATRAARVAKGDADWATAVRLYRTRSRRGTAGGVARRPRPPVQRSTGDSASAI